MKRLIILILIIIGAIAIFAKFNVLYTQDLSLDNDVVNNALKNIPENLDKETLKTFN